MKGVAMQIFGRAGNYDAYQAKEELRKFNDAFHYLDEEAQFALEHGRFFGTSETLDSPNWTFFPNKGVIIGTKRLKALSLSDLLQYVAVPSVEVSTLVSGKHNL